MIKTTRELFISNLQKLYTVENQLLYITPLFIEQVQSNDLKKALQRHLDKTREQEKRLREIGTKLGVALAGVTDEAMLAIIKSEQTTLQQIENPAVKDLAIIGGSEKIEHYEIAAYESVLSLARKIGETEVSDLLEKNFYEEQGAASALQTISSNKIGKVVGGLLILFVVGYLISKS